MFAALAPAAGSESNGLDHPLPHHRDPGRDAHHHCRRPQLTERHTRLTEADGGHDLVHPGEREPGRLSVQACLGVNASFV
jgi:hypothetical protein